MRGDLETYAMPPNNRTTMVGPMPRLQGNQVSFLFWLILEIPVEQAATCIATAVSTAAARLIFHGRIFFPAIFMKTIISL